MLCWKRLSPPIWESSCWQEQQQGFFFQVLTCFCVTHLLWSREELCQCINSFFFATTFFLWKGFIALQLYVTKLLASKLMPNPKSILSFCRWSISCSLGCNSTTKKRVSRNQVVNKKDLHIRIGLKISWKIVERKQFSLLYLVNSKRFFLTQ